MKAYLTAVVALVFSLALAKDAQADLLYWAEREAGDIHIRLGQIAHEDFEARKRPAFMQEWGCREVIIIPSTVELAKTDMRLLVRVAPWYWLECNTANKTFEKRAGSYDGLMTGILGEIFGAQALDSFAYLSTLVRATIKIESDFNPESRSHAGAMGLIQIMPSTVQDASRDIRQMLSGKNPFDPQVNLMYGIDELKRKFEQISRWVNNGSATWYVKQKDASGRVTGKEKRTITLQRDRLWYYVLTAYNRGTVGWLNWEWNYHLNGMSDYATKWAINAKKYCPGIDLVNGRCSARPEWLMKALSEGPNANLRKALGL